MKKEYGLIQKVYMPLAQNTSFVQNPKCLSFTVKTFENVRKSSSKFLI
jgi:hypothetical protein